MSDRASLYAYRCKALLRYLLVARSRYRVHSPFVYDFIRHILRGKTDESSEAKVRAYRQALSNDHNALLKTRQGAHSNHLFPVRKTVAQESAKSGISLKYGRVLMRLIQHYQLSNILELGTSLGIGTTYLALGQKTLPHRKLISLEGCPATHAKASAHFQAFWGQAPEFAHVSLQKGSFEEQLPFALNQFDRLNLLFLDGDHRYESVLENFQACSEKASANAIFVIDDIHWSKAMEEAWHVIQQMPKVTLTIDLFQMGLVFFNPRLSGEHFVLRH